MKFKYSLISFFLIANIVFSQQHKMVKADKKYDNLAYKDAANIYKKVFSRGFKSVDLFEKLGNSYYFNANYKEAAKWYEKLFALDQTISSESYFRYSQSLKAVDNFKKADEYLELFSQKSTSDSRGKLFNNNKKYLKEIEDKSGKYSLDIVRINSKFSDFGATVSNGRLIFSSARPVVGPSQIKSGWTHQPFLNLYYSKINADGSLLQPKPLSKNLNSKVNESSAVFTKDGKTVYFTRNNFIDGKVSTNGDELILLKLYKATNKNGRWVDVTELPFNSDRYNVAHPALSPDEKILYFSSNMPGTLGSSDLFKVTINPDGTFGKPENLGNTINTEGRETFPFISKDNELYFASEGQLGLGGLDIFISKINPDGTFSKVSNLGVPVNSSRDDFAFYIDSDTKSGFFSSDRAGGKGCDDIYRIRELKLTNLKHSIEGTVFNSESSEKLSDVKVSLLDENKKILKEIYTDSTGEYRFAEAESKAKRYVHVEKANFEGQELEVQTDKDFTGKVVDFSLIKSVKPMVVGDDLAKVLELQPIYFDRNKSNIRKDAAAGLEKIVEVMKKYPSMNIEVRSHTDSRNANYVSLELSEGRAKSCMIWIINRDIDKSRISAKGFGELQLLNKCADGVSCTEEEHDANNRTEFIITKM